MRRPARIAVLAASAAVTAGALGFAAPATADPGMPPCAGLLSMLCNMVPTMPELDHDIDLTKNQPPADLNQEHLPPADVCTLACV